MDRSFLKPLVIVLVVLGANAVGVYSMAVSRTETKPESAVSAADASSTPEPVSRLAPSQDRAASPPVPKDSLPDEAPPAQQKPPADKPEDVQAEPDEAFDPLLGERFDEGFLAGRGPANVATGMTPMETQTNQDIARIELQAKKMSDRLRKKMDNIASKMKLDERLRDDLAEISLDGLNQVIEIRKQFAGQEMTDADRAYMKEQIQAANYDTAQRMRSMLGEDEFKQFRKESRYYDNPNARVLDQVGEIKKQNRQLQKKIDQQSREMRKYKPGGRNRQGFQPRRGPR